MRIKDISLENRPRERLEKQGVKVLSDAELLWYEKNIFLLT